MNILNTTLLSKLLKAEKVILQSQIVVKVRLHKIIKIIILTRQMLFTPLLKTHLSGWRGPFGKLTWAAVAVHVAEPRSRSAPLTWLIISTHCVCVTVWLCCSNSLSTHRRQKLANTQTNAGTEQKKRAKHLKHSVNMMKSACRQAS